MKSTEVYRALRERIGPWCKAAGFRRTKGGMLGWYRTQAERSLVFWFQCSRHGWDPHAGSEFTLEFQLADRPEPGHGLRNRARFAELLSQEELEQVRHLQNDVIRALRPPPPGHWSEQLEGRTRDWFLGQFEPVAAPYSPGQDVWLRYGTEGDVACWAEFLLRLLPRMVLEFEARAARGTF